MEKFEQFELVRELGRGATAKIYLARHLETKEEVTLKIFHPKIFHDTQFRQRIQREIKLSSSLKHDNIVAVRDVIYHTDPPALVMDYVDGANLEQFQSRLPYVLPEVSVLIVIEILKGLEYAHSKNLVHRDLKPENVLVRKDGRIFVTDFGLAKLANTTLITQANVILGSVDYMSPEQTLGDSLSAPSDLFSIGTMLYYLVTGTRPFSRDTTLSTLQAIREEEPEHPSKRNPKVSSELGRIIQKALSKKISQRFQTAAEFRLALEQYLASLGLTQEHFNLSGWAEDPSGFCMEALRHSSETLVHTCESLLKAHANDKFLETLAHLTLKAPQSPSVGRLTGEYRESLEKKRKPVLWWFVWGLIGLTITLAGVGGSYYFFARDTEPRQDETTALNETPILDAKKAPPVPVAPLTSPKTAAPKKPAPMPTTAKAKGTGTVHFNVNPGVRVFWDGKEVNPSTPLRNQTPGKHQITLVAPGFDPLQGSVMVKDNEPTVVNAR